MAAGIRGVGENESLIQYNDMIQHHICIFILGRVYIIFMLGGLGVNKSSYGQSSNCQSGKMVPGPGMLTCSKGILKHTYCIHV